MKREWIFFLSERHDPFVAAAGTSIVDFADGAGDRAKGLAASGATGRTLRTPPFEIKSR